MHFDDLLHVFVVAIRRQSDIDAFNSRIIDRFFQSLISSPAVFLCKLLRFLIRTVPYGNDLIVFTLCEFSGRRLSDLADADVSPTEFFIFLSYFFNCELMRFLASSILSPSSLKKVSTKLSSIFLYVFTTVFCIAI